MTAPYAPLLHRLRIACRISGTSQESYKARASSQAPQLFAGSQYGTCPTGPVWRPFTGKKISLPWPGILSCIQPWQIRDGQRRASSGCRSLDLSIVHSEDRLGQPSPLLDSSRRKSAGTPSVDETSFSESSSYPCDDVGLVPGSCTRGHQDAGKDHHSRETSCFPSLFVPESSRLTREWRLLGNGFSTNVACVVQRGSFAIIGRILA